MVYLKVNKWLNTGNIYQKATSKHLNHRADNDVYECRLFFFNLDSYSIFYNNNTHMKKYKKHKSIWNTL